MEPQLIVHRTAAQFKIYLRLIIMQVKEKSAVTKKELQHNLKAAGSTVTTEQ